MSDDQDPEALRIAEFLLEETGRGILGQDFEEFAQHFALPWTIGTFDGTNTIENAQQMRAAFDRIQTQYLGRGATELVRRCIAARITSDGKLVYMHETRIFAGPHQVQDPHYAYSTAVKTDGKWQIIRTEYAIMDDPKLNQALMGTKQNIEQGQFGPSDHGIERSSRGETR